MKLPAGKETKELLKVALFSLVVFLFGLFCLWRAFYVYE